MLTNIILGAILELIGAILMIYNLAQGWRDNLTWAAMGFAVMVSGMILLYAAFRPVVM